MVGGSAQEEDLLLVAGVLKPAAGVEDIELIDVLDIDLMKSKTHAGSVYKEVKSVESFGLGFGNGWDVGRLRGGLIPRESSSDVLHDDSLFFILGRGHIMKQGAFNRRARGCRNFSACQQCHERPWIDNSGHRY